jgi:3-oxoacyl-[acyl-carrier protein] reductase
MIKQREGHIILISTGIGLRPRKLMSSYAAAKAGVFGLMKAAALELGEYNIKVNAVNPGLIIHESLPAGAVSEGYISETMLGRLSKGQDLADFLVYLSHMNNISGQIINLDSRVFF